MLLSAFVCNLLVLQLSEVEGRPKLFSLSDSLPTEAWNYDTFLRESFPTERERPEVGLPRPMEWTSFPSQDGLPGWGLIGGHSGYASVSARGLVTQWDSQLELEDAAGIGISLANILGGEEESGRLGGMGLIPLSVRYWRPEEKNSDNRMEVVSFGILGLELEAIWSHGLGFSLAAVAGVTRFKSLAPGGDSDSGASLMLEAQGIWRFSDTMHVGIGMEWDWVNTSLNENKKYTVSNRSVALVMDILIL